MTAAGYEPRIITLDAALDGAVREDPERIGWIFDEAPVTFGEMSDAVDRTVAALTARGIGPGDRVAVWLPNKGYWPYCLFACARLGAMTVALNTRWTASEAAYVLRHSAPKLLLVQRTFLKIDFVDLLGEIRRELGSETSFEVIEVDGADVPGALHWTEFIDGGRTPAGGGPRRRPLPDPSDPVLLQYTSGTTSRPKGALVPHMQIVNYGVEMLMRIGVRKGDVFLNTQPLYHVGGSCGALPVPLTLGCTIVMPTYYEPERVLELTARHRPVARSGTETMYLDEMNHPRFSEYDTSSVRAGWTGAPPALFDRIRSGYPIEGLVNLYGATEGGGSCGSVADPPETRRVTVGRPLSGCEVRIADIGTGSAVPSGVAGEICFRGWNRIVAYFAAPELTAQVIDGEGFLHSGDIGLLDAEGYLHFRGRIKEMIRPGGENVAAEEVEEFLLGHPGIRRAAVIAAPDLRLREVVMAIVERDDPSLSEAAVKAYCTGRLAGFRVPTHVRFVTEWPLTSTGKIARAELRRRFVAESEMFRAVQSALEGTESTP